MGTALRVEWRKTVTTRMWWVLLLVMAGYVALLGLFIAFATTVEPPEGSGAQPASLDDPATLTALYTLALPIGYVFPLIVGVLAITTEFRHQTLTPTLLGEPRRGRVLSAKLLVALVFGLLFGVVALAAGVGAVVPAALADGAPLRLDDTDVLAALGRAVLAMALWAGIGVGVGALLRNQVAAIVAALAFSQLVEPFARFGLSAVEALEGVARYLPGAATDAMAGASLFAVGGEPNLLPWWQGGLVLAAYALVLVVVGGVGLVRRDVA